MPLRRFSCQDFRCLVAAEFEPHPHFTLVSGANASGKTSLLEAIGFLGRGRSFRGAGVRDVVRHGAAECLVTGIVETGGRDHRLGVRHGRGGLALSVDGDHSGGLAALASALPLQVIDPDVHRLVGGAPDERRRFLDWMGFHVEQGFLESWRRFRRALKQRNALLREGQGGLDSWDEEFARAGEALHEARARIVATALPTLESVAGRLLGVSVGFEYMAGWPRDQRLAAALAGHRERDRQAGTSQYGPHRADLRLRVDERVARKLVSRGQQKLLACALVLASIEVAAGALGRPPLLLLDDPAAELDAAALGRLMDAVGALGTQVVATALAPEAVPVPAEHAKFHVEQGALRPA